MFGEKYDADFPYHAPGKSSGHYLCELPVVGRPTDSSGIQLYQYRLFPYQATSSIANARTY